MPMSGDRHYYHPRPLLGTQITPKLVPRFALRHSRVVLGKTEDFRSSRRNEACCGAAQSGLAARGLIAPAPISVRKLQIEL
jgi:hypothetical protein